MAGGINYTPGSYATNHVLTAAELATEVTTAFTNLQGPWTAWTLAYTSGFTLGNGTATGRWYRVGKTITAKFRIVIGSTTTVGAALIQFPVAISSTYSLVDNVGSGNVFDSSVGSASRQPAGLTCNSTAGGGVGDFFLSTTGGQMNATTPFTWATSDILSGTLVFEAA